MESREKRWFIIYTKPPREKKVLSWLKRKRVEHYCPFNEMVYQGGNSKKILEEPLFKSYIFLRINETEQLAFRFGSIINFVYRLNKPAFIGDEEIMAMKKFINQHKNIKCEKIQAQLNNPMQVISEFEINQKDLVISLKNKIIKLVLPS